MAQLGFCQLEGCATGHAVYHRKQGIEGDLILLLGVWIQQGELGFIIVSLGIFQIRQMSNSGSFDWYALSKLDTQHPNIESFKKIIKNSHFGSELSRVPVSLRQKLLILFQSASAELKTRYFDEMEKIQQLEFKKRAMQSTLEAIKGELDGSMAKINGDQGLIEEKKRIISKMKEKIKRRQEKQDKQKKGENSEAYFCPLCTREDFKSRSQFSFHLLKEHSNTINPTLTSNPSQQLSSQSHSQSQSQSGTIPAEVKDLILSLKDKEIQLMEMMLSKKKQMETMELEKLYELELRKIRTQANFMERRAGYTGGDIAKKIRSEDYEYSGQDEGELKGESQYVFYQPHPQHKSQPLTQNPDLYHNFYQPHSQLMSHPYQNPQTQQQYTQRQRQRQRYHSHLGDNHRPAIVEPRRVSDYYNIFSGEDVALSVGDSLSPQKIEQFGSREEIIREKEKERPKQQHILSTPVVQYTHTSITRNLLHQKSPTPLRPSQQPLPQQRVYNPSQALDPSYLHSSSASASYLGTNKKYASVYGEAKSNVSKFGDGHIFNSGPLMDDVGDGSDYGDYFGGNQAEREDDGVVDEEIIVVRPRDKLVSNPTANIKYQSKPEPQPQPQTISSKKPHSHSHSNANSSNILLQYSKDKSFLQISRSKEQISHSHENSHSLSKDKSSDLIELSNSFSKRGLGLQGSKSGADDESSINLSDLRFSKLDRERNMKKEREKEEEEKNKEKERQKQRQSQPLTQLYKKYIPAQFPGYQSNPNILNQFKKQQPLAYPHYNSDQNQHEYQYSQIKVSKAEKTNPTTGMVMKKTQKSTMYKYYQQGQAQMEGTGSSATGVLQEFLYRPQQHHYEGQQDQYQDQH